MSTNNLGSAGNGGVGANGNMRVCYPLNVVYQPQQDITTWELARVVVYVGKPMYDYVWEELEPEVKRHFRLLEPGVYLY